MHLETEIGFFVGGISQSALQKFNRLNFFEILAESNTQKEIIKGLPWMSFQGNPGFDFQGIHDAQIKERRKVLLPNDIGQWIS